ncbi:MAG TPA: HAMP domain-containing sensor histidine kinase [Spirochaetota bacterium]|nr:HAMP domain-containing sensor histidine kinase [Spirochaetota bacterium]
MKKKRSFKIQWQLLTLILPLTIIPFVALVMVASAQIFNHLELRSANYYGALLKQVANNIDFVYEQYGRVLNNIFNNAEIVKGLNAPPHANKREEIRNDENIVGNDYIKGRLREMVEEKIDGHVMLIQLDRKSLLSRTDYKIHYASNMSYLSLTGNIERLILDPLFIQIKKNNDIKMILGKTEGKVFSGYEVDKRPVILFPYYPVPPEKPEDTFSKFVLVLLNSDFIPKFYQDIEELKYGTLYILDQNDQILSFNHPNSGNDYYEYNEKNGKYILGSDKRYDSYEKMGFNEYQLLNTDDSILKNEDVLNILKDLSDDNYNMEEDLIYTGYKGVSYLTITEKSKFSQCKFIYFLPAYQIRKPIYGIIGLIVIIACFTVILVAIISYIFSRNLTKPIKTLNLASTEISKGNYDVNFDITASNELGNLSNSFKKMASEIKSQTEELKEANLRLQNLDKVKNLFFNSLSHQLRTPLNHILGYNEFLLKNAYDPLFDLQDISEEIIDILESSGKEKSGDIIEYINNFNDNFFSKNVSTYKYFLDGLKEKVQFIDGEDKEKISELIADMDAQIESYPVKVKSCYKSINNSGKNLLDIIDNFSELSKMEAMTSQVKKDEIFIDKFLNVVIDESLSILKDYKKEDVLTIAKEINYDGNIFIDTFKVKTILLNFISNSIKFSEKGKIIVKFEKINGKYIFYVSDQGSGIKKEDFDIIFTEFGRTADAVNIEGTGLGLALSKKIAELLNGDITFNTAYGEGSEFKLTIPNKEKE